MSGCCGIRRVGTLEVLTDSADFAAAETALITTAFNLVVGRTYQVEVRINFSGDTVGNVVVARLRLDNILGTQIDQDYRRLEFNTSFRAAKAVLTALHVPAVTGSQTFVVSGQVEVGAGNARREGNSARPNLIWVDRIG